MAGVQSIERAFALLRALAIESSGVTELAGRVDLPKSTVARLLQALEHEGAVEREETESTYRIGQGFADLFGSDPRRNLIAAAHPFLIGLSAEIGEASGLDVIDDGWVQFIDQVAADNDVQVRDWTGESGRAHALPAGLAMLAHGPAAEIQAYLKTELEQITPSTVTSLAEVRERLVQVRSAGYIWCYEEFSEGINSVAAPVFDSTGVVAALQVHGPTYRFPDPNRTHDVGRIVADAAERLTEQLQGSHHLAR